MGDKKSPNYLVEDEDIRILLDRRAEILEQVNKLQAEYHAIERILVRLHNKEKPTGIGFDMEIKRLQELKKKESWLSGDER